MELKEINCKNNISIYDTNSYYRKEEVDSLLNKMKCCGNCKYNHVAFVGSGCDGNCIKVNGENTWQDWELKSE